MTRGGPRDAATKWAKMDVANAKIRMPAEWEPQAGVQLTWPHRGTDWAPRLDAVEPAFLALAREISMRERLLVACPRAEELHPKLLGAGVVLENVELWDAPSNDTWARDHAPITVFENGAPVLLDFRFNAWGGKFAFELDNALSGWLHKLGAFGKTPIRIIDLVLEGGSIESDGCGTIMTTSCCLLTPSRNAAVTRTDLDSLLKRCLGARRVIWLEHGALIGDDTDGHIDTLARFCSPDTIAYSACEDPTEDHYAILQAMEEELRGLRQLNGAPYRLVPLPLPGPCYDAEGNRAPATYANFLILNGAVLAPTYGDPADAVALQTLRECFPNREIVGLDCRVVIEQHGALHCLAMQYPKEVDL